MQLLSILVCFSLLLQASLSVPLSPSKPKPVDLAYTCMEVLEPGNKDSKPDEVPVIMLHGLTQNKESWHGVNEIIALATKKKVCVADLRNHGESPWNDEEYNVIAMTEDVRHLMDRINAPKAIVIGHSLGGRTAVHLSMTYPERLEKIIVEDMRPNGVTDEAMKGVKSYARVLIELDKIIPQGVTESEAKEQVFMLMKEIMEKDNKTFNLNDHSLIPVKCSNGKCHLSVNPVVLKAAVRNITELISESSGRFDGPALFIYGSKSLLKIGEDESNIKKMFPNAKLVAVKGAGHTVHTHKEFTREVIKFINSE